MSLTISNLYLYTVMVLSFWTDRPLQTVQTQIRLLLEEQSDHGLHYLSFCLYRLEKFLYGKTSLIEVSLDYKEHFGCPKI